MGINLSVVTPCYNDFANLAATLASLREELRESDELLIIDSSQDKERARFQIQQSGIICHLRYIWMPAAGVFAAQNKGIQESRADWIQVLNSGDRLCIGARAEIDRKIEGFSDKKIHVFRQMAIEARGASYVFSPSADSVWPHQSIIVHRLVYAQEGLYPEQYRFGADQIYFARVRRTQIWKLHSEILTEYLLGGLSAGVSWTHLGEIYAMRRALGQGIAKSFVGGYISPLARKAIEIMFGAVLTTKLKARFTRLYNVRE